MKEKIKSIYSKYKEIINYLIVGVLTTIVSLGTYYLLVFTILNPNDGVQLQIANIISWIFAVTFAYFTNRKYVFESKETNIKKEMSKFYLSRVSTLLIDMALMFLLVTILRINDKIVKFLIQIIVTIANYILSKLLVFKKNKKKIDNENRKEIVKENKNETVNEDKKEIIKENKNETVNEDKKERKKYYLGFTLVFIGVLILVFGYYFFSGRTFVWGNSDGWTQHYKALVYYSDYLKEIVNNLISNHQLITPNWDFAIGEGADILNTLNYYVIGDPFTVLSVAVPSNFMWIYYCAMIILRIYLAGLFFSFLCFKMGHKNKHAILAGSLTYMFCFWMIFNANRHPYFLNPMVYFPLILLGIEKILKKEKPYLLIGTVFISGLSNFYFFYNIVLLTIIYTFVRLIVLYKKNIKEIIINLFKIGFFSLVGVLLASVVFVPVCYYFLSDTRMTVGKEFNLLYPLSYYSKLPSVIFSNSSSYWLCMGYSAPSILAIFMLFRKKKENTLLKILLVICIILMLIPAFGQIFNGLSYMSNKWSWAFALLIAYIFVSQWNNLLELNEKDWKKLVIYLGIYSAICVFFPYSKNVNVFISIAIALITLVMLYPTLEQKGAKIKKQKILLGLVIISITINGYLENSIQGNNYASQGIEAGYIQEEFNKNETEALKEIYEENNEKSENIRYSGRELNRNVNMIAGLSSTQYYWSTSNPYNANFRTLLELAEYLNYKYEGYDDRTALNTLASVKYFVTPEEDNNPVPYGFEYIKTVKIKEDKEQELIEILKEEIGEEQVNEEQINFITGSTKQNYNIYKNKYFLPLAYTYSNYITEQDWNKLNAVEKQETMLQAVVLDDDNYNIQKNEVDLTSVDIPYTMELDDSGIYMDGNKLIVTSANASIKLKFKGKKKCETYFSIKNLGFEPMSTYDLYFGDNSVDPMNIYNKTIWDMLSYNKKEKTLKNTLYWSKPLKTFLNVNASNGISKTIEFNNIGSKYYAGKNDFSLNLNYSEDAVKSIKISFTEVGTYTFDSMAITCQPMKKYSKQVKELKEDKIKNFKIGTDTVKCSVKLSQPKFLVFSIPYSEGWEAYVDGKKVELLQANIKNMGIELEEGEHNIKLKYNTPYLKEGILISGGTFVLLIAGLIIAKFKRKKEIKEQ